MFMFSSIGRLFGRTGTPSPGIPGSSSDSSGMSTGDCTELEGSIGICEARCGRTVIVGGPSEVRDVRRMLKSRGEASHLTGCIVLHESQLNERMRIRSLGVVENLELIVRVQQIDIAYVSIPTAMIELAGQVISRLNELGVLVRRIPTVGDMLAGRVNAMSPHVDPGALLDRENREVDKGSIDRTLRGKRVLITGAGGSIGSELARIAAGYGPSELALMDRSENGLFEIDRELGSKFGNVSRRVMLHDVVDAGRTLEVVKSCKPDVIFHAAAHKHVPMMEDHPREAMVNNFFGTKSIADAAHTAGVGRFVMISTDKAVNPTSVMGATKRAAELYVQHMAERSETVFSMVRFGNVLGSACSVVPIWIQQLSQGGPLTVTDPRMTRFFMTIPEAALLVIQAASLEQADGHVFVLDMGESIRIVEMAERFVRANGLEPGTDVAIVYTGVRPGEKLYEELAYDGEDMLKTAHASVRIVKTEGVSGEHVERVVKQFEALRERSDAEAILKALREAVPQMQGGEVMEQKTETELADNRSRAGRIGGQGEKAA